MKSFAALASLAVFIFPVFALPQPAAVPPDEFTLGSPTRLVIVYPDGGLTVTRTVILEPTGVVTVTPTPTTTKKPTWPPRKTTTSTVTPKTTKTTDEPAIPTRTIILN